MILPTKRINPERSLLGIGADILALLSEPKTVSRLWSELSEYRANRHETATVTFDWFVLALDLLYGLNAVDLERGRLFKKVDQ